MYSDYPFIKKVNNETAVKFATWMREMVKNENEPLK